jgi:hypothetical protein
MASGHGYRANRPNTWLLRPTLQVKILLANPEPSTHGPTQTSSNVFPRVSCSGLSGPVVRSAGRPARSRE